MKTILLAVLGFCALCVSSFAADGKARELKWVELLPKEERGSYSSGPPAAVHDYLSDDGTPVSLADMQSGSSKVNPALNGARVRIAGFIVPLEIGQDMRIRQFLLVPYFGACIHIPPPPPNQIVYVKSKDGIEMDVSWAPFYVSGKLIPKLEDSKLGVAAYTLESDAIELYKE